jgi:tRNA 2-thiouridine synthesizing protein D
LKTLSVVVTTSPSNPLTATAIDYINQAIESKINLSGIFFYQDGVLNAAKHLAIPNDEYQINEAWKQINEKHNIELHVCISACEKRGLSDETSDNSSNISSNFTVSGLGELVDLTSKSERVVQF